MKKSTGFLERISKEELDMMAKEIKKHWVLNMITYFINVLPASLFRFQSLHLLVPHWVRPMQFAYNLK